MPRHELLRQWCGHRAAALHERVLAAKAENHRLDLLVADLIQALDDGGETMLARVFEELHERDRTRPETVRPVVDRIGRYTHLEYQCGRYGPRHRWA
jgi:hypothetical protein